MIEEKRKQLIEKIRNNNLSFNSEEEAMFVADPEIKKEVVRVLSLNESIWNQQIFSLIDEILDDINPENKENFWLNCAKYMIKSCYSINDLETLLSICNATDEFRKKINDLVEKELAQGNIRTEYIQEEILIEFLDRKKYDLISQLKQPEYLQLDLTEKTINRLLNEYPFDKYKTPLFLKRFISDIEEHIQKFDLQFLSELIISSYTPQDLKVKARIHFIEKLKELDEAYLRSLKINWNQVELDMRDTYDSENILFESTNMAFLLYQKNILDLLPYLVNHPQVDQEELIEKLVIYINNSDKINGEMFPYLLTDKLLNDTRIINALIDNGYIDIIKNPTKEMYDRIEENIKNKNPKYQKILDNFVLTSFWSKSQSTMDTIIKSPFLKKLIIQFECLEQDMKNETITILKEVLLSRNDVVVDINDVKTILELFPEFLKQNNVETLNNIINYGLKISKEQRKDLFNKYIKEITDLIKNNIYFGKNFLNDYNKFIIETNRDLIKAYLHDPVSAELLFNYVNHHEELELFYSTDNFNILKEFYSKKYNVSIKRLEQLEKITGPIIIRYIDNENIQSILKMTEESFEKLSQLFVETTFTMTDLESAYDSLKQYEFSKKYPDEISVFANILHAIEDKDEKIIEQSIEKISKYLDSSFYKKFMEKYELPENYNNEPKLLLELIIKKIISEKTSKREKYINILHDITDYYILKKREEYRNTYNLEEELLLPYEIDERTAKKTFIQFLLQQVASFSSIYLEYYIDEFGNKKEEYITLKEYVFIKLKKYNIDETLAIDCINYYINNNASYTNDLNIIKSNIHNVIKSVEEILKEEPKHAFANKNFMINIVRNRAVKDKKIKRTYTIPEISVEICDILASLNIKSLEECVFTNEEVYNSLLNTMKKRKLHKLPSCLKTILNTEHVNVSDDYINLASFISYYAQIYDIEKKKLVSNNKSTYNITLNLINILINAEVYSSVSSIYSQILGDEDAKLIKANPGPHSASYKLANNGRLKEAIELTKKLFLRQEITIPTFVSEYELSDEKQLKAIVGNFTHPSNLTHGERTQACMRIGGVGESLFYFAIDNPNAFHIRFEDPQTHEYISRVTGFRNGNTVFLNELRNSCNKDKYDDTDVIQACKQVAQQLIEESKNSPSPIENVVIHKAYALENSDEPIYNLGTNNIKEGLPFFYTDVSNNVIVLATTAKEQPFVKVNFDKTNIPMYKPAREKPRIYNDVQAVSSKINRINSINQILNGENYEYLKGIEFEKGLTYAIVSEDWYIYVDELGNIYQEVIEIDPRAKEEMAKYLIELETKINTNNQNQEVKHGI